MSLKHPYIFALLLMASPGVVLAATNTQPASSSEVQMKFSNTAAYLGVRVDLLPDELSAQLPEDVLVGQGVLITGFAENSPAKGNGLEVYDILLTYDRHALMHPKEFIDMVRNDKPGREVKIKLVRKGEILTVPVTLASQQYALDEDQLDYQYNMQTKGYDGLIIKQYSRDDFEAAVRYLDPQGVVRSRTFKGPFAKIQREVFYAPDIPVVAKQDLIGQLSKRKKDEEGWFGKWIPFSDGNFSKDGLKNFGLDR